MTRESTSPMALAVLGTLVFCFYVFHLPPSVYWLDSGELTAAGAGLGIPHPTGFPLYAVLARLAALVPLGEIGFRVALLSSLCAAVTSVVVARTVMLGCHGAAGLIGGIGAGAVLAVSMVFFRHATVAEVYAPTALLLAVSLYLLARVGAGAGAAHGLSLAVVVGLGLGLHGSYRLLVFWPFAVLLVLRLRHGARWPLLAPVLSLGIAAALHAYLPLRSHAAAAGLDWGHPGTLGAMLDHARARSIFLSFGDQMFATESERWVVSGAELLGQIVDSLGPVALVLAVVGAAWLPTRRRVGLWLGCTAILWVLLDFAYGIWVNPMGTGDLQNGAPMLVAAATCAGAGIAALAHFTRAVGPAVASAAAALAILAAGIIGHHSVRQAARGDSPSRWAEAALDQAPAGATLLVIGDSTAAPLLYMTHVAGARPDVVVLVRQLLPDRPRTAALWRRSRGAGAEIPASVAELAAEGAVLWQPGGDSPGMPLIPAVPLFAIAEPGQRASLERIDAAVEELHDLFAAGDRGDRVSRRVLAQALTQLAIHVRAAGRPGLARAEEILAAAVEIDPDHARAWINRGALASRRGDLRAAIRSTERGIAVWPNHLGGRINLARYYLALGRAQPAARHARRAVLLSPGNASALALGARAQAALGRPARARILALRARLADPRNRDVADLARAGL